MSNLHIMVLIIFALSTVGLVWSFIDLRKRKAKHKTER